MWSIQIHRLVFEEDFPTIDQAAQQRIIKAVHKKLSAAPKEYGKPLAGQGKGYWRLRVDDYRVIYQIQEEQIEVFVIKVGIRRGDEVYQQLSFRIRKI